MTQYTVGIDIGGSHIGSCVVDLSSGSILDNTIIKKEADNTAYPSVLLNVWTKCIQASISASGVNPQGLGFAFPGPFDYRNGICKIEGVDKFEHLFGLDVTHSLLSALQSATGLEVRYINDAGAFALGEAIGGCARDASRIIALTLGTGIGSGFIAGKQLIETGPSVPANGWVYNLPFDGGIADNAFSTRWFCHRFFELSGKTVAGAKEIADQVPANPVAGQIFKEYGQRLADFILPLVRQFQADIVVLGGNISRAYSLFGPSLESRLSQQGENIAIRLSSLRDNAAMLGAASLFIHHKH